jgi:RNA polymerase sigma-70 factor (ECF subfamily)
MKGTLKSGGGCAMSETRKGPDADLMRLMVEHQRRLFAYIYALVPNRQDASDILQDTSVVICEKFHEYRPGTDFVAWATRIAFWEVRRARQKYARSKVVFDQEVVDALSETVGTLQEELDVRHEALAHCLKRLPDRDREMILLRYEPGASVEEAARRVGRSMDAAYKALARIRKLLMDCVSQRLGGEGVGA